MTFGAVNLQLSAPNTSQWARIQSPDFTQRVQDSYAQLVKMKTNTDFQIRYRSMPRDRTYVKARRT